MAKPLLLPASAREHPCIISLFMCHPALNDAHFSLLFATGYALHLCVKIETADLDSGLPVCQVLKELREKLLKNLIGLFLNFILSGKSTGFKKTYF